MVEVIVAPDAEEVFRIWLTDRLSVAPWDDVQVFVPPSPPLWPARSVLVTRTGGSWVSLIDDEAQLTFESRAATPTQTLSLATHVRNLLGALSRSTLVGDIPIHGGSENASPYYDPDPLNTVLVRVTQTWAFRLRGKKEGSL
jgi:hypothetical protein